MVISHPPDFGYVLSDATEPDVVPKTRENSGQDVVHCFATASGGIAQSRNRRNTRYLGD
jgi:hypothetical protein